MQSLGRLQAQAQAKSMPLEVCGGWPAAPLAPVVLSGAQQKNERCSTQRAFGTDKGLALEAGHTELVWAQEHVDAHHRVLHGGSSRYAGLRLQTRPRATSSGGPLAAVCVCDCCFLLLKSTPASQFVGAVGRNGPGRSTISVVSPCLVQGHLASSRWGARREELPTCVRSHPLDRPHPLDWPVLRRSHPTACSVTPPHAPTRPSVASHPVGQPNKNTLR